MSVADIAAPRPARDLPVAPLLFAGSLALYVVASVACAQAAGIGSGRVLAVARCTDGVESSFSHLCGVGQ